MLRVKDCLVDEIITAGRGTPLKKIIQIFRQNRFHSLPVVDNAGHLVGKISLAEILSVFQPHSAEINQLLKTIPFIDNVPEDEIDIDYITPEMGILVVADEIMTSQYFTISSEETIAQAYSLMQINNTKLLFVIDKENKLLGVLGLFDIMYSLFLQKGVID